MNDRDDSLRPSAAATAAGTIKDDPAYPAMRDGAQCFQLLADEVKDHAVFLLDPAGTVTSWNPGAERLFGYRAEQIIGQPASVFYAPEDLEAGAAQRVLALVTANGQHREECWRIRRNGSRLWATIVVTALRGGGGELLGFGEVTRDAVERVRASELFHLAIHAAPTGMMMIGRDGTILLANSHVERLFGYAQGELIGRPVDDLLPERLRRAHAVHRTDYLRRPQTRLMGAGRQDLYGLRSDGTEVPFEIGLNPLRTSEGDFVLSSIVDISARKRAERERDELLAQLRMLNTELEHRVSARTAELTVALKQRDALLQEVHHRVKNNLQVISSLINTQLRKLELTAARDALEECQTRVVAIALIHEQLYQSKDYSSVRFAEFVRSLAENVFRVTGLPQSEVALELATEDIPLPVDRAIPCALIINELMSNALKHGFRDGRRGKLRVELIRLDGTRVRLTVQDDGVGLPLGFELERVTSMGMQLVRTLSRQLAGSLVVTPGPGASFQLTFASTR